ncbi:YceD family protein [Jiulongibacter sp. NS-SX5]|uniref:YceD family protein n=1 Tax=Jiulongibacter sp. NS-SX5 TaxID=3463854 RepID=UPI004058AD11
MKKYLAQYEINILGLDEKKHQFDFEGGKEFFESFDQDIIENGEFKLDLELDKSATMMRLHFDITGSLELVCDRSLEVFEEPIEIAEKYIYKFGDRNEVVSEDVEIIPFGASEINIAHLIFDFIGLAVPMKKLHPKFRDEDEYDEMIYSDTIEEKITKSEEETEESDPRWEALKALKKKL